MMYEFIENCLLLFVIILAFIILFFIVCGPSKGENVTGGREEFVNTLSDPKCSEIIENKSDIPVIPERQDNLAEVQSIVGGYQKNSNSNNSNNYNNYTYDEYDDDSLIDEQISHDKNFKNVVIDTNNFIYFLRNHQKAHQSKKGKMTAREYIGSLRKVVAMLSKQFKDKELYFVVKDPDTDEQERDLLSLTKTSKIRDAHKKIFEDLVIDFPNCRFIAAYGDAKYRDDYAAIWIADTLPDETILLSRDRFRDVSSMESRKLTFKTYGKRAAAINKIINKPFNFVSRGAVRTSLIGYAFTTSRAPGFYRKRKNRGSEASDIVYLLRKRE